MKTIKHKDAVPLIKALVKAWDKGDWDKCKDGWPNEVFWEAQDLGTKLNVLRGDELTLTTEVSISGRQTHRVTVKVEYLA